MSEWNHDELVAVVEAYLDMLRAEVGGEPYSKIDTNRRVQSQTARTKSSIEFKFSNASAVLHDLGLPWIQGYKPRTHYQQALRDEIEARKEAGQLAWLVDEAHLKPKLDTSTSGETPTQQAVRNKPGEISYQEALYRIRERAFGGSDVAAKPGMIDDGFWPTGQGAPASDKIVDWLNRRLSGHAEPALVFLVGGPGNGKSHLTARITAKLELLSTPEAELAQRSYEYATGSTNSLVVINDATIGRNDGTSSPLITDIEEALASAKHVVANVNRGILFEEAASQKQSSPALDIVRWLQGHNDEETDFVSTIATSTSYLKVGRVRGHPCIVVAVYMDSCSLLEKAPLVAGELDGDLAEIRPAPYRIHRFKDRPSLDSKETSAGETLARFLEAFPRPADSRDVDPFAANLASLSSPHVQAGTLTLLRGAEIATGQLLTYREIWGAITRLLVGDAHRIADSSDVLATLPPNSECQPATMYQLANFRFHQGLVGATRLPGKPEMSRGDPVTALTRLVDPVRDARPGRGSPTGWAGPVLEAFAARGPGKSILAALLDDVGQEHVVNEAITPFDYCLDKVVTSHLSSISGKDSRALLAWYGEYLLRLYAVATGVVAFHDELDSWTQAWRRADSGNLPTPLRDQLMALLLPRRNPADPNSELALPVFDARTEPYSTNIARRTIVATMGESLRLASSTDGEALLVQLKDSAETIVELELDFAMMREARSCREGHVGITEFSDTASPRLERFRAALVRPRKGASHSYHAVFNDRLIDLDLS